MFGGGAHDRSMQSIAFQNLDEVKDDSDNQIDFVNEERPWETKKPTEENLQESSFILKE